MKKIFILIAFICTLFLFSCANNTYIKTIKYETDIIAYDNTPNYFRSELKTILRSSIASKSVISDNKLESLLDVIVETFNDFSVSEKDYLDFIDYIKENENVIINSLSDLNNNDFVTKQLLDKFIKIYGYNSLSILIYNLFTYYYDNRIKTYNENIKAAPKLKEHYLNQISLINADKEIFLNIGIDRFNKLIKSYIMINNLINSDLLSDNNGLSNQEILLFTSKIDINVNLENKEWTVIFNLLKNISLCSDFMNMIISNNDVEKFSKVFNNIISFTSSILINMDEETLNLFRNSNKDMLINDIFNSLNEDELEIFKDTLSIKLKNEYLEYFEDYLDIDLITSTTNLSVDEFLNDKDNITLNRLYMVIRTVFYD